MYPFLPTPTEQGIRGEYERERERKTESGNSLVCQIFGFSLSFLSRRVDNVTIDLFQLLKSTGINLRILFCLLNLHKQTNKQRSLWTLPTQKSLHHPSFHHHPIIEGIPLLQRSFFPSFFFLHLYPSLRSFSSLKGQDQMSFFFSTSNV